MKKISGHLHYPWPIRLVRHARIPRVKNLRIPDYPTRWTTPPLHRIGAVRPNGTPKQQVATQTPTKTMLCST